MKSIVLALSMFGLSLGDSLAVAQVGVVAEADSSITTSVRDPEHPAEPWIVTSFRLPDESDMAFTTRHFRMVDAVRRALGT